MNTNNLFEQMTAIFKGSAYDAIRPEYERLQLENMVLKSTIAQLEIRLRGEQARVKALQELINEVRPDKVDIYPLSETDKEIEDELEGYNDLKEKSDRDDLKDIF